MSIQELTMRRNTTTRDNPSMADASHMNESYSLYNEDYYDIEYPSTQSDDEFCIFKIIYQWFGCLSPKIDYSSYSYSSRAKDD